MSNKPVIAIYFDPPGRMDYPFSKQNYFESYALFSELCAEQGVKVYIVRGNTYEGNMKFSSGWQFSGKELQDVSTEIKADVIYDKDFHYVFSAQSGAGDNIVNPLQFDGIARNKWTSYTLFSDIMTKTWQINRDNWQDILAKVSTEKAVLKPEVGFAGKGVIVKNKADIVLEDIGEEEPYIMQEFLDSALGIPGLIKGMHDLRIFMFNGQAKLSYIRTPQEGSYLANLAQGGSITPITMPEVPKSALEIAQIVDKAYAHIFPRVYTVDLLYVGERPYLIETNTRPGFQHPSLVGAEFARTFHQSILDTLLSSLPDRN